MAWQTLRSQIKTFLEAQTDLQEVSGSPMRKFDGFPAAYVVPSDNINDYETNRENVRVYSFLVRIFYSTKDVGVDTALTNLEQAVDSVLDALDKEDLKPAATRTIGVSLDSDKTFLNIFAVPGVWGSIEEEKLFMAELTVRVRISVDIQ